MPSNEHKRGCASNPVRDALSTPGAEQAPVSLELAVDLALCGGLMAGLSLLAQHLQPDFQPVTLFTGLVGGGLCVLWGVLGRRRGQCRGGAKVTLVVVACVFAFQAWQSWAASTEGESKPRIVMLMMTVLIMFCAGTLSNLSREGKRIEP